MKRLRSFAIPKLFTFVVTIVKFSVQGIKLMNCRWFNIMVSKMFYPVICSLVDIYKFEMLLLKESVHYQKCKVESPNSCQFSRKFEQYFCEVMKMKRPLYMWQRLTWCYACLYLYIISYSNKIFCFLSIIFINIKVSWYHFVQKFNYWSNSMVNM